MLYRGRGIMKSRHLAVLCAVLLLASAAPQVIAQPAPTSQTEAQAKAAAEARLSAIEQGLHPQKGTVRIPAAHVSLALGDAYYFLPADQAKRVLTEGWGNPPDQVADVLGMVFPEGKSFRDETWGAVIEYQDTGHVSDKDAANQDYDSVLADMKSSEEEANKTAKEQGYSGSHLIGWAQAPTYDASTKTLIWARDIEFDGAKGETLNYDLRTLGRTGVLSLNMIDSMDNLSSVRSAATGLGTTIKFDSGAAYADFNPSTDKLADYGLAGLVAAGAGIVVAKKLGLLAILLVFLKKGIAVVIALALGARAWFKRRLGRGKGEEPVEEPVTQTPAE
jgi:uncharacterized membrane-anchored protein